MSKKGREDDFTNILYLTDKHGNVLIDRMSEGLKQSKDTSAAENSGSAGQSGSEKRHLDGHYPISNAGKDPLTSFLQEEKNKEEPIEPADDPFKRVAIDARMDLSLLDIAPNVASAAEALSLPRPDTFHLDVLAVWEARQLATRPPMTREERIEHEQTKHKDSARSRRWRKNNPEAARERAILEGKESPEE